MKKTIFTLFLIAITGLLAAQIRLSFKTSQLDIQKKGKSQYSVKFNVNYSDFIEGLFDDTRVPITTEGMVITGSIENLIINEMDFLYSQNNIDLNGDGDFNDSHKLRKKSGKYYLGDTLLKPIISPRKFKDLTVYNYYSKSSDGMISKIGKKGKPFSVYNIDYRNNTATFGIGTRENPLVVENFPNPNVQVLVVKKVDSIRTSPPFSIAGEKNYITFTNEKIFEGEEDDRWNAIIWTVKPLILNKRKNTGFTFNISGISPPFAVIVFVNISLAQGIRLRTRPVMKTIRH